MPCGKFRQLKYGISSAAAPAGGVRPTTRRNTYTFCCLITDRMDWRANRFPLLLRLLLFTESRLSHRLSASSRSVVHAADEKPACALLPHRASKSIREDLEAATEVNGFRRKGPTCARH